MKEPSKFYFLGTEFSWEPIGLVPLECPARGRHAGLEDGGVAGLKDGAGLHHAGVAVFHAGLRDGAKTSTAKPPARDTKVGRAIPPNATQNKHKAKKKPRTARQPTERDANRTQSKKKEGKLVREANQRTERKQKRRKQRSKLARKTGMHAAHAKSSATVKTCTHKELNPRPYGGLSALTN